MSNIELTLHPNEKVKYITRISVDKRMIIRQMLNVTDTDLECMHIEPFILISF